MPWTFFGIIFSGPLVKLFLLRISFGCFNMISPTKESAKSFPKFNVLMWKEWLWKCGKKPLELMELLLSFLRGFPNLPWLGCVSFCMLVKDRVSGRSLCFTGKFVSSQKTGRMAQFRLSGMWGQSRLVLWCIGFGAPSVFNICEIAFLKVFSKIKLVSWGWMFNPSC